jgi:hypothetical protein
LGGLSLHALREIPEIALDFVDVSHELAAQKDAPAMLVIKSIECDFI